MTARLSRASQRAASHAAIRGAQWTLLGILCSGPLAVAAVAVTHPQPPWQGPQAFARHFHPVQVLPYAGGIVLVLGFLLLTTGLAQLLPAVQRTRAALVLVLSAGFTSLVGLNYALQTSYVPVLATRYEASNGPLLSALTMVNPRSFAWALEMWGWGLSGMVTWLLACTFHGSRVEQAARSCFLLNGWLSLAGTAWTVLQPGWVLSSPGLLAFALWNVLLAALAVLTWVSLRRRLQNRRARSSAAPCAELAANAD